MYSPIAFMLMMGLLALIVLWFLIRNRPTNRTNRIHEPLDTLNTLIGPTGPVGPAGPAGPAGPTGASISVPSLPSRSQFVRYVTIQHIPNGNRVPVSLADIQFLDNQNTEIRIADISVTLSSRKQNQLYYCTDPTIDDPYKLAGKLSSYSRPYRRANVLDSDLRTFVSTEANTDTEFITFDLGREYPLSTIVVFNRPTCTEFHQTTEVVTQDPECRTRLNDCELELRDNNNQLFWSAPFPKPPRDVYVFAL